MPGAYDKNDIVRCRAEFRNTSDVLTDPTSVVFKFKNPAGTITTYTYGTDVELVKENTGIYYVDIDIDSIGSWSYRFEGSGSLKTASESKFTIKQSEF